MAYHSLLHIAMFPWLAFSHMIPYLELAKLIAQRGHKISFISTPRNIDRLPKFADPNLVTPIDFVKITMPHDENPPENAEATSDVPYDKVPYLNKAFDHLQQPLAAFLQNSSPNWIIYDFAPHWLPSIGAESGISRAVFCLFNTWSICFYGSSLPAMINGDDPRNKPEHFTIPPEWIPFPTNVALRFHEAKKVLDIVQTHASGMSDLCRFALGVSGCDVISLRSCFELEMDWLDLIGELYQKPVVPMGLLPPGLPPVGQDNTDEVWNTINEWLGKQSAGSVVYVALGTEVTLSEEEITELALVLELSGVPFFWVMRKVNDSYELPDAFEERVKGRGIVWTSWAPQVRILGHKSVGAFLTHCGWSSIIDGLHFGRALIMLPFQCDQGLNARFFEAKMIGKEIPRDEQNGLFTRNLVARTVRHVISEDEGQIFKEKAGEIGNIFGDKILQYRYVDNFIEHHQNHSNTSKA